MKRYKIKTLKDGRAMLNLGCGYKTNWDFNNIDASPYAFLAHHKRIATALQRVGILSLERYQKHLTVDPEIVQHDLRKGIPFPDASFDVVYSCHVLEHIDVDSAPGFLNECRRVLKSDGTIRVVVPDLEIIVNRYTSSRHRIDTGDESGLLDHIAAIHELFDMIVRIEKLVDPQTTKDKVLYRVVNLFQADHGHRWMYDRYSLSELLRRLGYTKIKQEDAFTSGIDGWNEFGLDVEEGNKVYRPSSLYMEGTKP
jgi:SAM-dependent methyltransferase